MRWLILCQFTSVNAMHVLPYPRVRVLGTASCHLVPVLPDCDPGQRHHLAVQAAAPLVLSWRPPPLLRFAAPPLRLDEIPGRQLQEPETTS
jgi:hypothetical protein